MHIHAILCARSSRCDCPDPCHPVTLVSPCMRHASTCLMLWRASARLSTSMSIHVISTNMKPYWCAIEHHTRNSIEFSLWKWGTLLPYSHNESLVRIVFCVLWCTWGEVLLDFRHENKAKCCRIFTMEIWHCSKRIEKASTRTMPIPKSNLKA